MQLLSSPIHFHLILPWKYRAHPEESQVFPLSIQTLPWTGSFLSQVACIPSIQIYSLIIWLRSWQNWLSRTWLRRITTLEKWSWAWNPSSIVAIEKVCSFRRGTCRWQCYSDRGLTTHLLSGLLLSSQKRWYLDYTLSLLVLQCWMGRSENLM